MINEKLELAQSILTDYPETRGDGNGNFLNKVYSKLHLQKPINFNEFNTESWTRARRKVLELHPELDERTKYTNQAESCAKKEMAA